MIQRRTYALPDIARVMFAIQREASRCIVLLRLAAIF